MDGSISIKGTRDGLTITLGAGELDHLYNELSTHLRVQGAFFRGGMVALELGERPVEAQDIARFQGLLSEHSMTLRSIAGLNEQTQCAARELGLHSLDLERPAPLTAERPVVVVPTPGPSAQEDQSEALARAGARGLVLRRRLRAGQIVRHSGSIVILGDVNVGAEINAGGDIVVWGRLRGMVHAGCLGNTAAVVCALELNPLQIRIADLITRPEEGSAGRADTYPEVAHVRDEGIIVERWTGIHWRD
jgi:septum site-determining protein MinC